jgi:ABC-2 type transport system permease protein
MLAIFKKEIVSFLGSLSGYVVLVVFFVATGLTCWLIPSTSLLDYGYADTSNLYEAFC